MTRRNQGEGVTILSRPTAQVVATNLPAWAVADDCPIHPGEKLETRTIYVHERGYLVQQVCRQCDYRRTL